MSDDETPQYLQQMLEAQAQFMKLLALKAFKPDLHAAPVHQKSLKNNSTATTKAPKRNFEE